MLTNQHGDQQIRQAIYDAARQFLHDPNITMIDYGYRERDKLVQADEVALRFFVQKKLKGAMLETAVSSQRTQRIPPEINGIRTDVPEGIFSPHFWWPSQINQRASRWQTLRGGISISNEYDYTYATLGGLVVDKNTGKSMIISNWHVLAGWGAQPGWRIYQPGRADGGSRKDTIATLSRDGMNLHLDAAVAQLSVDREMSNEQMGFGQVTDVAPPKLGGQVKKSGRGSNITIGIINGINGHVKLNYWGTYRTIHHVMTIIPRLTGDEVSRGGDSGSFWLTESGNQAVGLHFAGDNYPERALAMDLETVLNGLQVELG